MASTRPPLAAPTITLNGSTPLSAMPPSASQRQPPTMARPNIGPRGSAGAEPMRSELLLSLTICADSSQATRCLVEGLRHSACGRTPFLGVRPACSHYVLNTDSSSSATFARTGRVSLPSGVASRLTYCFTRFSRSLASIGDSFAQAFDALSAAFAQPINAIAAALFEPLDAISAALLGALCLLVALAFAAAIASPRLVQ